MRNFTEPSCNQFLRQPLVFGVPFPAAIVLAAETVGLQIAFQGNIKACAVSACISVLQYGSLRIFSKFAKPGWDQSILFSFEKLFSGKEGKGQVQESEPWEVQAPDTLDEYGLLSSKTELEDRLWSLEDGEALTLRLKIKKEGAVLTEFSVIKQPKAIRWKKNRDEVLKQVFESSPSYVYSLIRVPVVTDPLWLFSILRDIKTPIEVIFSAQGLNQDAIKRRIESSRKLNLHLNDHSQVDSDVSFEQASHVLEGISRGDERVVEVSLTVVSGEPLDLDPLYFQKENNLDLTLFSALGLKSRLHRSHLVRVCTATDLVPNLHDPIEDGSPILKTLRGNPLYFDPQDPRLDALHWVICGATGTGKSFFAGTLLLRMIEAGRNISVLFIDHKRSFKRVVCQTKGWYLEPEIFSELQGGLYSTFAFIDQRGVLAGVELSDLPLSEKKKGASYILSELAQFLGERKSDHVIYVVIDESWKFMKDDPEGVQQAFREFRKYDAAAIAITQSLKDLISNETGQSIVQNSDITVLLRQKEDVTQYKDLLDLNEPEMARLKRMSKRKGEYSECLIKTPFMSRIGRLYPTEKEHELLRTDNLRKTQNNNVVQIASRDSLAKERTAK